MASRQRVKINVREHDLHVSAMHEAGHAVLVSLYLRRNVEVALFPNAIGTLDPIEHRTILGQVRWTSGRRRMGKIYMAAVGVAGVCSERMLADEATEANDLFDEITGSLEAGELSETDAAPCRALTTRELEKAIGIAYAAIREHRPAALKLVRALKREYRRNGSSATLTWKC